MIKKNKKTIILHVFLCGSVLVPFYFTSLFYERIMEEKVLNLRKPAAIV